MVDLVVLGPGQAVVLEEVEPVVAGVQDLARGGSDGEGGCRPIPDIDLRGPLLGLVVSFIGSSGQDLMAFMGEPAGMPVRSSRYGRWGIFPMGA
jgi:hypothetical protein